MTLPVFKIGDRLNYEQEDIFGVITEIFENDRGEQASVVLALHDGKFAAIDLSKLDYADPVVMQ